MTPNPEIWGASETWIPSNYFGSTGGGNATYKAIKPKIANFGDNIGTLAKGNTVGKTPINSAIDPTICPCGQDKNASCFGKIALFKNYQNQASNAIPYKIISPMLPINWFMYDGYGVGYADPNGHKRNWNSATERWSPNANISGNWNGFVSPYVYWQTKSIMNFISVECITDSGGAWPSTQTRTLADWKANYNTQKICNVWFDFGGLYNVNVSNNEITFNLGWQSSTGTIFGVSPLMTYKANNEDIIDYATFAYGLRMAERFSVIGYQTYGNYYDINSTFIMTGYEMFEGWQLKTYTNVSTEHGWLIWPEIPYSEANYNKIMSMAACFGCLFTDTNKTTYPLDMIDNDMYIPVIDQYGVAHGDFTHGSANANNPFLAKDSVYDYDYNPYGFDFFVGNKIVRKIYYRGQQIKTAYFADKKL